MMAQSVPGNLAASWYVALKSGDLGDRPRPVELFGRQLVAWRDDRGLPVLLSRRCPHMGASLADGKRTGGLLECPFHGWRFDRSGGCARIPGAGHIPLAARVDSYPVAERYGYIWAWYGSPEPMFPLPDVPALQAGRPRYWTFRFADMTRTTVRRIMENTYDADHLLALHGLTVGGPVGLRVLTDPAQTRGHGLPIPGDAWFGAELSWPGYIGRLGTITRLIGTNAQAFVLRVDGWAGGQRISYLADGVPQYHLLLAASPVAANKTVQHIAVAIERSGRLWPDLRKYLANRAEVQFASDQDLPIFNTIEPGDRRGVHVAGDRGVLRFRRFYQQWVDRAAAHE
jgi:aminopyrrolnitrin oxygenase